MKSYRFFEICKSFDKESKKLRKVGLCFTKDCFIKSFNMIINHFFVSQAHSQPNIWFLISG